MKNNFMIFLVISVIVGVFFFFISLNDKQNNNENYFKYASVCFSENCVMTEIADTPQEREKGLMFRESLKENKGMFFVFEEEGIYPFWMKNTLIPLEIIWISKTNRVAHIEFAYPCTTENCISYTPKANAIYVLEVNQGFIVENNIQIGDLVKINYLK